MKQRRKHQEMTREMKNDSCNAMWTISLHETTIWSFEASLKMESHRHAANLEFKMRQGKEIIHYPFPRRLATQGRQNTRFIILLAREQEFFEATSPPGAHLALRKSSKTRKRHPDFCISCTKTGMSSVNQRGGRPHPIGITGIIFRRTWRWAYPSWPQGGKNAHTFSEYPQTWIDFHYERYMKTPVAILFVNFPFRNTLRARSHLRRKNSFVHLVRFVKL